MLKTIVLVCAAGLPPSACTPANALVVVRAPASVACGLAPLADVAASAIRPEPGKSYPKIVCTR